MCPGYIGTQCPSLFIPSGTPNNPVWQIPGPLQPGDNITIIFSTHVASEGEHENCVKVEAETDSGNLGGENDCAVVEGLGGPGVCACLYSAMDGMEMLEDENWDANNPDAGNWSPANVIPQEAANNSDWGVRFPDLPWSFMYDNGAEWVFGNNDWDSLVSGDHEYYRVPFTVPVNGNCVRVRFQAYIDHSAKFYIDGPGFDGPTFFYAHDPDDSMYNHDPVEFWVDPDAAAPVCLGPGEFTIYIDHVDTAGVIYGLIFTAECVPCECPCQCEEWDEVQVTWTDTSGSWTESCGEVVSPAPIICPGTPIEVDSSITCEPSPPCEPNYHWEVTEVGPGPPLSESGTSLPASFTPTSAAIGWNTFEVVLNADCDGSSCPSCTTYMRVKVASSEGCNTLTVGECNDFDTTSPPSGEPVHPSDELVSWIGEHYHDITDIKDCDEDPEDQFWAHTFELTELCPCSQIESTTLDITVQNDDENDHLKIGCITNDSDAWEHNKNLTEYIDVGEAEIITLNLSSVPGLLACMETNGWLDVAIDDDSPIDCAVLTVCCGG